MVMCSEPVTRTPASGLPAAYLLRIDTNPGISCSAMAISLRPQSAKAISATLYPKSVISRVVLAIQILLVSSHRDMLICNRTENHSSTRNYAVHRKNPARGRRPESSAHPAAAAQRGTVGRGDAGDSGH